MGEDCEEYSELPIANHSLKRRRIVILIQRHRSRPNLLQICYLARVVVLDAWRIGRWLGGTSTPLG